MVIPLPMVRRVLPELFANKIVGIQPMAPPNFKSHFHIAVEGKDFFEDFDKMSELENGNKTHRR